MKAKLIKDEDGYSLFTREENSTNRKFIATIQGMYVDHKLSKQNCDEIFGVVDVIDVVYKQVRNGFDGVIDSFTEAFAKECINKAMESNKDKVFTIEDIRNAYQQGEEDSYLKGGLTKTKEDNYIQSLRESTEIEVEIKMEPCFYDQSLGGFSTSYTEDKPKEQPKLDSDGCLILKKL